ncbi:MAG: class II aldolase/adducin family protein [Butyrivibrio sp.]|nr:class II aldolase/adducin family protein [Butyrivibrio sp.]
MSTIDNDDLLDLKKEIIEAGLKLQQKGLIVRTWGNISCRVNKKYFLITPSGIRYEDLTPDKIVLVKISDLSYKGDIKPSSEYKVHAACYRARKDISFIVHTHQVYATVAGALGKKEIRTEYNDERFIVPCALYGYPGSDRLADNVGRIAGKYSLSNAFIMANHGAVCFGNNSYEAIAEAEKLEIACQTYLADVCNLSMGHGLEEGYSSHRQDDKIVFDFGDIPDRVRKIHEEIYAKRPDINYIVHNKSEAVLTISRRVNQMRPLLDDFAQLIGVKVRIPVNDHGRDGNNIYVKKNVNAVFVLNDGAYCLGATLDDAQAVSLVLDKGCMAHLAVLRYGEGHFLSTLDCIRMNRFYRNSYSKLADKKS